MLLKNLSNTLSNKVRNKLQRSKNGNGTMRQNVSIIHWNLEAKMWPRKKLEIEAVILQYVPDIFVISEVNLLKTLSDEERMISGYRILTPEITGNQNLFRLVVLVKETIDVKVIEELNDNRLSAMWLKVGARGRRPMIIGAIYREFRYIHLNLSDDSASEQQQLSRWNMIIEKWKAAARMGDVTVIGDLNIDFRKWGSPDPRVEKLVDRVKLEVETLGFLQMVEGMTRSWKQAAGFFNRSHLDEQPH